MYNKLTEIPVFTSAQFAGSNALRVTTTVHDHFENIKKACVQNIVLTSESFNVSLAPSASDVQASALSPSGKRLVLLREISDQSVLGGKKRVVEIWMGGKLEASRDVTKIHEAFYTDERMGCLSFSPSETRLLYTAETKAPGATDTDPYATFRYVPPLGEGYPGKKKPALFLLQWDIPGRHSAAGDPLPMTGAVVALTYSKSHQMLIGEAIFAAEDHIIATGYKYTPDGRLLGAKFCTNRPACLLELIIPPLDVWNIATSPDLTEALCSDTILTPYNRSCRCPRVYLRDVNSSTLVWLSNPVGGAHASCTSLHSVNLQTKEEKLIIDTVWEAKPNEFPGIYTDGVPAQPFLRLGDAAYIAIQSTWHSRTTILLISLADGASQELSPDHGNIHYSWNLLGTDGENRIVCSRSSPTVPPELLLGQLSTSATIEWTVIVRPELDDYVRSKLASLETNILPIPGRYPTEAIVISSNPTIHDVSSPLPCVTIPHGGPHSTTTTSFSPGSVALALEGYTVCLPNYTGSIGFGQEFVQKLVGQCGTLDVGDCISAIRHVISIGLAEEGPGQQFIQGGSHGGFLAAHLIGQFPDFFSAAVIRNPVISMGEVSTTDIPDWYYEECDVPFTPTTQMTPDIYRKLYDASPISYISQIHTPVLLLIGGSDERVSPTQGKSLYHGLKGNGKIVEMLHFPYDSHSLDRIETSRVSFEAGREWIRKDFTVKA